MKKYLILVMLMLSSFARADAPTTKYELTMSGVKSYHASGAAACAYAASVNPTWTNLYFDAGGWNGSACYNKDQLGNTIFRVHATPKQMCSDNTVPNTSLPLAQQCAAPPPECSAGQTSTKTFFNGTGPLGSATSTSPPIPWPTSDGTCNVDYSTLEECRSRVNAAGTGNEFYCTFSGKQTGVATPPGTAPSPSTITPAPTDKPATSNVKDAGNGKSCPAGTVSLGVDSTGGMICGGSGTSPIIPPKTEVKTPPVTTNNPDGSTTKVESSTRSNSDGSTTTTTTTTVTSANGGTTVTQSTSTSQKPASSGGGAGTNDSTDDKKDDFCIKNPTLNVCKNSEVTGGDCSGGSDNTACTGDAISCAILRQQRKEYCELTKENPQRTLGEQILAGNDPLKDSFPSPNNSQRVDVPGSLNDTGFLGGGACFPDKTISVMGASYTIEFSKACEYMLPFRYMVMLMAAFFSLQILSRGVFGK